MSWFKKDKEPETETYITRYLDECVGACDALLRVMESSSFPRSYKIAQWSYRMCGDGYRAGVVQLILLYATEMKKEKPELYADMYKKVWRLYKLRNKMCPHDILRSPVEYQEEVAHA